jgi:hypothetical protein
MDSLRTIKHRLDAAAAKVPPPPGKPFVVITVERFDPENPPGVDLDAWESDPDNLGQSRHPLPFDGVETPTRWLYKNAAELEALRERFKREYEDTRGPNDVPPLLIHLIGRDDIAEMEAAKDAAKAATP